MSEKTHSGGFLVQLFISFLASITPIFAADLEAAKSANDQAYTEMYKALSAIKKPTREDFKRMREKYVTPAENSYSRALQDDYKKKYPEYPLPKELGKPYDHKAAKERSEKKFLEVKKAIEDYHKWKKAHPEAKIVMKPVRTTKKEGTSQAPSTEATKPEVILDGSDIPKEIEFPGKKQ